MNIMEGHVLNVSSVNGRLSNWRTNIMEDDLNERHPQWKTTKMEVTNSKRWKSAKHAL